MELDALKANWAEVTRQLEASVRLNRQLLGQSQLTRARTSMQVHVAARVIEVALNAVALLLFGSFMFEHRSEPRFLLPAMALHVFTIVLVIDLLRQIRAALAVDYAQPVAAIQRQLEQVRVLRVRHVQFVLLVSVLLWTPLLIVALEGLLHVDAYHVFGAAYLWTCVVLGLAIIPLAIWLSRVLEARVARSGSFKRLLRDIAGKSLAEARAALTKLTDFERE